MNGTDDNAGGREAEEELGCDGEGVGKDDSDAEGEEDVNRLLGFFAVDDHHLMS